MKELKMETTETSKKSSHALAAANIRRELRYLFPGQKFTVRARSFAGGSAIDVGWTDGRIKKDIEAILNKYEYGSFNGMDDNYGYKKGFDDYFGSAKYIHAKRSYSDAAYREAFQAVHLSNDEEAEFSLDDAGHAVGIDTDSNEYQSRFYAYLRAREFKN